MVASVANRSAVSDCEKLTQSACQGVSLKRSWRYGETRTEGIPFVVHLSFLGSVRPMQIQIREHMCPHDTATALRSINAILVSEVFSRGHGERLPTIAINRVKSCVTVEPAFCESNPGQ
ncbi:hypothetical protein QLX08_003873 [Tetragonisca angustula]|uniref:Uncharacterized protein n=1 Tax=Tetragonisca angustula TaxID=166442 RepID=A0AAW1A4I7_9HYME